MQEVPKVVFNHLAPAASSSGYQSVKISGSSAWAAYFREVGENAKRWMTISAILAILTMTHWKASGEARSSSTSGEMGRPSRSSGATIPDTDRWFSDVVQAMCRRQLFATHTDRALSQGETASVLAEIVSNSSAGNGIGLLDCLSDGIKAAIDCLKDLVTKMCLRQNHPVGMVRFCPKPLAPLGI